MFFAALRDANGLLPLDAKLPNAVLPVGLLQRRGLSVPVVWIRRCLDGFETTCLGLRQQLGGDGLLILVARDRGHRFQPSQRIVVLELVDDPEGGLRLERGLDVLDPEYRTRAIRDPLADLDHVRIRFGTKPSERHVVMINGHDFDGFRKSDGRFLRFLLLAAARVKNEDDGWLDKMRFRDADDKDRALERLREELTSDEVPGLSREEQRALIKSDRGTGRLRLGVPPANISFDGSLNRFEFLSSGATTQRSGKKGKETEKQVAGARTAAMLLRDCRRLGVPGDPNVTPCDGGI